MRVTRLALGPLLSLVLVPLVLISGTNGSRQNRPNVDEGEVFRLSRPSGRKRAKPPPRPTYQLVIRPTYRVVIPSVVEGVSAEVGITVWRARPGGDLLGGLPPLLRHQNAQVEALVWRRVDSDATLSLGDVMRLAIEVPRPGFLYVVDREKYSDGSVGDPYLIFPTSRINGGDNRVSPGRLVEIPSRDDNPPFFTLVAARPQHIGEVLTLIVTPEPMTELPPLGRDVVRLGADQVSSWEEKWGRASERYEMAGGAGQPWTEDEKLAGARDGPPLTEDSPLPQTIYRVSKRAGEPVVITVPLPMLKTQRHMSPVKPGPE